MPDVSDVVHNLMLSTTASQMRDALEVPASADLGSLAYREAPGAEADLDALTSIPSGPEPFTNRFYKTLTGDLALTDAGTPTEGFGYRLRILGDTVLRTVSFPSSISSARGEAITSFDVPAGAEIVFHRYYGLGAWRIVGDPDPWAFDGTVSLGRLAGNSVVAETVPLWAMSTTATMSTGSLYGAIVELKNRALINYMRWWAGNNPNFQAADSGNRVGVYQINPSTWLASLVASSAHAALTWNQNTLWTTRAFTAPFDAPPGLYVLASLYVHNGTQSVAPAVGAAPALTNLAASYLNTANIPRTFTLASQTDLPATIDLTSGISGHTSQRYFQLRT